MKEEELFELWDQDGAMGKTPPTKSEVEQMVQEKSTDVFNKIRFNIIVEAILSFPVCIFVPLIFRDDPVMFWMAIAITIAAILVGLRVYGKYLTEIKRLNQLSLLESLQAKISILKRYIQQLHTYLMIFGPLGLILGISHGLEGATVTFKQVMSIGVLTLLFLILFIWLGRKYIHRLYGRHLEQIEKIYSDLKEQNGGLPAG